MASIIHSFADVGLSDLAKQFLTFAVVGAIGTACHFVMLFILVRFMSIDAVLASTLGAVTGAFVNYMLNRTVTFHSDRPHRVALVRFMVIAAISLILNAMLMATLTQRGVHYLLSQGMATVLVLLFNFVANRSWTFRTSVKS